jgi:carbonic anhydrase
MKTLTKELQAAISPSMALELLKEGNKRFVNNLKANRNL